MDDSAALFRTARRLTPLHFVTLAAATAGWLAGSAALAADVAGAPAPSGRVAAPLPRGSKIGMAGIARLDGRTTASGELYNRNALTAAHRSLPLGSIVRVTNVRNQRTVIVRINDRGPTAGSALIDLTPRAAAAIGLHGIDVGQVRIDVIGGLAARAELNEPRPPVEPPPVK